MDPLTLAAAVVALVSLVLHGLHCRCRRRNWSASFEEERPYKRPRKKQQAPSRAAQDL